MTYEELEILRSKIQKLEVLSEDLNEEFGEYCAQICVLSEFINYGADDEFKKAFINEVDRLLEELSDVSVNPKG